MRTIALMTALAILVSTSVPGLAQDKSAPPAKKEAAAKPADKPAAKAEAAAEKPAAAKAEAMAVKPAAKPAAAKVEMAAAKPAARPMADAPRRSRWREDARSCLQFNTNREISICAEKYR